MPLDDVLLNKAATIARCVALDAFDLLAKHARIDRPLAEALKKMVGFRNIAVHDCRSLQLPVTVSIITGHLDEFLRFSKAMLLHE